MKRRVYEALQKHIDHPIVLEKPKDKNFGHYATPIAFSLAKVLRRNPMQIAEELAEKLREEEMFEKVDALKGYVNIKLSQNFLNDYATWALEHEEAFGKGDNGQSVLLEFVSANPTGPLHIGHARGAVWGDVLARIGTHVGCRIEREYYVNDAGNQIYLLGLSVYLAGREAVLGLDVEWPEEYYRGEYILDLAREAVEALGQEMFMDEGFIPEIAEWAKERMLELINRNLADVGIFFDHYVSEKSLYEKWDEILTKLAEAGAVYEKDGKWWLKSTEHGDEKDRVVVREDGRPTYLAGDIIYHYLKFERGYDHYINIWGADHHGYIARVKAAIAFFGYDPQKLEIILSQMVSLLKGGEPYKMSKRAGNFILMQDIVQEIGADALRFIFLTKKSDTHLEFDIEDLKKEDNSNPIYYINYAHARVFSLFEKAGKEQKDVVRVSLNGLGEDAYDLLFTALILPEVLEDAFESRQLQKVTDYLKYLAGLYHKFYYDNRVIGTPYEEKLLKLSAMVALSLRVGLKMLGITAMKKM
ncbi:arginine--tRNA ligase [Hydrogenimonas sp.]|uniref:arginine--tRNA ligase n=1 Tax=Hydrogenimonas sp. TaxID=2231112 RepID=UPI0026367935|nr:arginine--tRNA ligase [Hydrogenimonas sp.]